MNKNLLVGIGVLVVVVVGYMLFFNSKQQTSTSQPTTTTVSTENAASSSAAPKDITLTLSEQNTSKESGTATLTEVGGKVKVTLKMTGAPATIAQPAHVHMGACPNVGAVKYPLTSVINGMSETILDVTLDQLRSQLPLGINVHKSAAESIVYVSCGDLKL